MKHKVQWLIIGCVTKLWLLSDPMECTCRCSYSKVDTRTGHLGPEREWGSIYTVSLTSVLDGVDGKCHTPAALHPGKRLGTHCCKRSSILN
jgi:hypothetical protein